jgi:class 3 adenylate cyclase/tetratricopeptide (TPR) repeat protein
MRCTNCEAENPDGLKFCNQCGTPFALRCPRCGFANAAGAKFCGECGVSLAAASSTQTGPARQSHSGGAAITIAEESPAAELPEGERKTVTALFADIKGSTELMEDLDPEEARTIVDPALALMIDAVHRYGGYIVQSTGDGIFALFGAPVAHEDHPQRALYVALRMQEDIRRYGDKVQAQGGVPLEIRVGVNTGEVVVRSIRTGEGHTEYTPIGHTTNLASRMQAIARSGSILTSEHTQRLIEGYFQTKALGPVQIKGLAQPVNVFEVAGLGPLRTRLQLAARRGLSRFVGRNTELEALRGAAQRAREGQGQIVAAEGEPGVGKSRLFHEFKAIARSDFLVLETFSVSHGKASPYLPVIDLLRNYFEITAEDDDRKRREKVLGKVLALDRSMEEILPDLFSLLAIAETASDAAQPAASDASDPQARRRRTLEAVKRLLLRESLNQPLLIIFEDLHWIDGASQAFLNLLVEAIGTTRILLLVNYRPEYHNEWSRRTWYSRLRLEPLAEENADELLGSLLGEGEELAALRRFIIGHTEGNPFFIEEMVATLFDQGMLVRDGGVKQVRPLAEIKVPATVQGVLASRIDRLAADEKELLQTLAAIGKQFPVPLVQAVAAKPRQELEGLLGELQQGEFIYEQPAFPDVEYTFKHALTQEVAYNSMLTERRRLLHRRATAAIESLYSGRLEDRYEELAHHCVRSADHVKAVGYLLLAGQQAMARVACEEAHNHATKGLELVGDLDSSTRAEQELALRIVLAQALSVAAGWAADETGAAWLRVRELSRQIGNTSALTQALLGLRTFHDWRGEVSESCRVAEEALGIARQTQDPVRLAQAWFGLGVSHALAGNLSRSREGSEQAMALYQSTAQAPGKIDLSWVFRPVALSFLARALWLSGLPDQALAMVREGLIQARQVNRAVEDHALLFGAWTHLFCRQNRAVGELLQRYSAVAHEAFRPIYTTWWKCLRGWLLAEQGDYENAIALIGEGIADQIDRGELADLSLLRSLFAETCLRAGRIDDGTAAVDDTLRFVARSGERFCEAELLRLKGELTLMRDAANTTEAERCFREAIEVARGQEARSWELRATTSLALLLRNRGKRDEARAMLTVIYNWFTEGFDTADLRDTKALLDELSTAV